MRQSINRTAVKRIVTSMRYNVRSGIIKTVTKINAIFRLFLLKQATSDIFVNENMHLTYNKTWQLTWQLFCFIKPFVKAKPPKNQTMSKCYPRTTSNRTEWQRKTAQKKLKLQLNRIKLLWMSQKIYRTVVNSKAENDHVIYLLWTIDCKFS